LKNWKKAELTIIKGEMKMDSLKKYIEHTEQNSRGICCLKVAKSVL
jgi:hypothetical protein